MPSADGAIDPRTLHALPGGRLLRLIRGDITRIAADAIVNAANSGLAGGGGVDGAIHRAGGPAISAACRALAGCPTGEAVATPAGNLAARYVIHAVAPIWRGGTHGERGLLASAYRKAMTVADGLQVRTLAFPSLGTGIYGNPIETSAALALQKVIAELELARTVQEVIFVLFSESDLAIYRDALASLRAAPRG